MNKRGLSHVEAILSFVIFVGFLIFAFFFFSPFNGNRVLDSSLDYTFREMTNAASVNIESYSVTIDFDMPDPLAILINTNTPNPGVRVEDSRGEKLSSGFDGSLVYFDSNGNDFVVIMFSEAFTSGGVSEGEQIPEENYIVSSSDNFEIFSESKLLELNESYHSGYEDLKKQFNLPNRVDFGFFLDFGGGDRIEAVRSIPEELEVVARKERIEIIRTDENGGDIEFVDLVIRIW